MVLERVMQTQDASADDADRRRFLPGPSAQICAICGWFWKGSCKHKKMHPQMTQIAADFDRGHLRKSAPSVDGSGKGHAIPHTVARLSRRIAGAVVNFHSNPVSLKGTSCGVAFRS
jgi:hypothetical protein